MSHPSATTTLPVIVHREMQFAGGTAIGLAQRWVGGQCCAIQTAAGIVGCGIYALDVPAEFGQAIAIAPGTPPNPLAEPEDLLEAKIVGCTPKAESLGIRPGMSGREAVERMLAGDRRAESPPATSSLPVAD
jgi:uncharacterized protein YunC (DUF1805 family)